MRKVNVLEENQHNNCLKSKLGNFILKSKCRKTADQSGLDVAEQSEETIAK
jgi:hypothetical protein